MATVNFIPYRSQSATALSRVAEYISQEKKTADKQLVSGINCSPQFAVQEFRATRMTYRKDSPVWFYHYTQSFSPEESITGQQAHEVAMKFAEKAWPDSQVLVATHVDAHHIHSHFIVNSVCFESGYMLRQGPRTLERLRKLSDEICLEHGLSVLPPDPPKHSKEPGTQEYRSMEKSQSWKMDLMLTIEDAMTLARSREHFIKLLGRKGYKVRWTPERKNITYTTLNGMRCRDNKLHEDKFLKEAMENEFRLRAEIVERIERPSPSTDAGSGRNNTLRHSNREELGSDASASAVTVGDAGRGSVGSGAVGYQSGIDEISRQSNAGIGKLHPRYTDSDTGIPEESVANHDGIIEETILTGWENERQLFTESLLRTGQDEEIYGAPVLDIDDTLRGSDPLGNDLAYLAGDLAGVIDENYRPQDSTTMRQPRRKKRALGQKPDEHDYEQKM